MSLFLCCPDDAVIQEGEYEVFSLDADDAGGQKKRDQVSSLLTETAQSKVLSRIPRMVGFALVPVIFFPLLWLDRDLRLNSVFGYLLLFYYIPFYIVFFITLKGNNTTLFACNNKEEDDGNTSYIFRIYSLHGIIPEWSNMSVAYRALLFRHFPIRSMSEFCSIKGGSANLSMLTASTLTWGMLVGFTAIDIATNKILFGFGVTCIWIGAFGWVLVGTFELDPFNKTMRLLHTSGNALMLAFHAAYIQQQFVLVLKDSDEDFSVYWHILPAILLLIITIIAAILWNFVFVKRANEYVSNLRNLKFQRDGISYRAMRTITKLSVQNICAEAAYHFSCLLAMAMWFINDYDCHTTFTKGCTFLFEGNMPCNEPGELNRCE